MALTDSGSGRVIEDSGQAVPWTREHLVRGERLRAVDGIGNGVKVTLAEACKAGDVLGYSSGWKRALATTGTAIQGRVVALEDGAIGEAIRVSPTAVVSGYTGGTPGADVYVAEGTNNGRVTETAPSTSGDCNTRIGFLLSATTVQFQLGARADSVA